MSDIQEKIYDLHLRSCKPEDFGGVTQQGCNQFKDELITLILTEARRIGMEAIGEDVNAIERNSYAQITKYDEKADIQNEYRSEARTRLLELTKGAKE